MSIYGAKRIANNIDTLLDELKVEMTIYTSNQIEAARNTIHDWTITFINTEKNIMDTKVNTLENALRDTIEGGDRISRDQATAMFTTAREEAAELATALRDEDIVQGAVIRHEFAEELADQKTVVDNALIQLINGVNKTVDDLTSDMVTVHGEIRADAITGDESVKKTLTDEAAVSFTLLQDGYTNQDNTLRTDLVTSVDLLSREIVRSDTAVKTEVYANADVVYEALRNEMAGVGVGGAFLPTVGGSMSGNIDMSNNKITNLPKAVDSGDPINYSQYSVDKYNDDRLHAIEAVLPGIPYSDIVLGLIPSVRSVLYSNNGEINTVMDIYNSVPFAAGNQPPLLEFDDFNQPYLKFNGEIGCDLIASNINGGTFGGANRNKTTLFFICKNKMRTHGSAFFWGRGSDRFSMHIQKPDSITLDYGLLPAGRLYVDNLDPPIGGRLEAWGYTYDGATANLFRSDFHIPPDATETFTTAISNSEKNLHIGSLPGDTNYRGNMNFYGMLVYPLAFAPNEMTTMFKYLNSRIRGIET